MFSDDLRESRTAARLSIAELAALSGTSRAAITDYEAGRKQPRLDTAERILGVLGRRLTVVLAPSKTQSFIRIDPDAIRPLMLCRRGREFALDEAQRSRAIIVESAAAVEHLSAGWGQIKTITEGVTVSGDALDIQRIRALSASVTTLLRDVERGHEIGLRLLAGDVLVEAEAALPTPRRELDFLARAIAVGADVSVTLHLTSGSLVSHGFPWLYVPFDRADDYRRAVLALQRVGDATTLVQIVVSSLTEVRLAA